ncbi:hypothetical protein [Burkholderia seminalis]|uniref:hypothetical protein n=1 Tax=Burkholderia seminalis TaxID=488731 RepID=UPI002654DF95|nr:hypothetical protein [Burkholderia seminalis]MDN7586462.1 hypothetical protein [Burkholderia seminalis]
MNKPKLAIISTYDELCGIASYTKALVPQLEAHFDITVFDLDQYLFRSESRKVQALADAEIKRICAALPGFDAVNIQLEHGTLGRTKEKIFSRLERIIKAAPHVCVTFHTILQSNSFPFGRFFDALKTLNVVRAVDIVSAHRKNELLSGGIYEMLRRHGCSAIVHTRRDMRMLRDLHDIKHVYDHPLAYYSEAEIADVLATTRRPDFGRLGALPSDTVVLGCFGFVSKYKGIDVALRALKLLPANYHLAIFGGLHPQGIQKNVPLDTYISDLLGEIAPGKKWLDVSGNDSNSVNLSMTASDYERLTTSEHPDDLSSRVHFMGALRDEDFPRAMAVCDVALLPYMEVGQSSSGPMSMAIEIGRPIVASRTRAFMQLSKYHPGRVRLFEVGNFLELAQVVRSISVREEEYPARTYNTTTNAQIYQRALTKAQ